MSKTCAPHGKLRILIDTLATDYSIKELKTLIESEFVNPHVFCTARVEYNCNVGITCDEEFYHNPSFYPLKFFSRDNSIEVWVSNVTAGYHGTGPRGTLKCLQLMGFNLSWEEEEILFTTKDALLVFNK